MTARARPTLGHVDGAPTTDDARGALALLTERGFEAVARPFPEGGEDRLLAALLAGEVAAALIAAERLPPTLPPGLALAAVTRRRDPRHASVTPDGRDPTELPDGARVGAVDARAVAPLRILLPTATVSPIPGPIARAVRRLGDDLDALIAPLYALAPLDLEAQAVPLDLGRVVPSAGQGAAALLLSHDAPASAWVEALQHRPSFDRVRAERAFTAALADRATGAHASVTGDGDLTLTAWAAGPAGGLVQATVEGDAAEAEELGLELADDVRQQLPYAD